MQLAEIRARIAAAAPASTDAPFAIALSQERNGRTVHLALMLLTCLAFAGAARAEADQVRIVMPYGLAYLPTYIAVDRGLIQKHAAAAGLGAVKVWPVLHAPKEAVAQVKAAAAGNDEAMEDLKRILEAREPMYGKADAVVDTAGETVEQSYVKLKHLLSG
mgnify:CR=1 FL=1